MNTRRQHLLALCALAVQSFSFAQAQGKVWRIGFLSPRSRPSSLATDIFGAFTQGLRDLGYVEGKNIAIEWRFAEGKATELRRLAAELVAMRVDVLLAAGTQAISAAQQATTTIPIVMGSTGDPVGSGFVKSLARPGGNITGLSNLASDIGSKHLELLLAMTGKLTRVAVLTNPDNSSHLETLKSIQHAAPKIGITVLPVKARAPAEIESAFADMARQGAQAVIVAADQYFREQRHLIAAQAIKHKLPSSLPNRTFTEAGGLMSYGQNVTDHYRRSAIFVDKILKGANPADLPVEQPIKFELMINGSTAKKLGLTIPQPLLIMADKVIE